MYRIEGPADGACIGSPGGPGPDIKPPQTTVKLKAANRSRTRMAARLRSSEPGSTFECKLDKRKWKACGAKRKLRHLDAGRHRFRARATDAAGEHGPEPGEEAVQDPGVSARRSSALTTASTVQRGSLVTWE